MFAKKPQIVGASVYVRTLGGKRVRYVNLDNTATTPAFLEVRDAVSGFMEYYGSIHRGSGYKCLFSTWLYEHCRRRVRNFVSADPNYHEVLFTANTTSAINKAARVLKLTKKDVVLVSEIEHSSNDLPWRQCASLCRYGVNRDNQINLESISSELLRLGQRVKLITVAGASNVTGQISPYHEIAEIAHRYGVPIFVDGAQLVPHRHITMGEEKDPRHLDFLSFSGHKLGAPYGSGVLIGPSRFFAPRNIPPDEPGGGTADVVTDDVAFWSASPDRFEAGTPNAAGVVALAKAIEVLQNCGMSNVAAHETRLWRRACAGLKRIRNLVLYVDPDDHLIHTPVLPFNLERYPHGLVAAILGFEYGIGVRHGRHCADSLVLRLLRLGKRQSARIIRDVVDKGMVSHVYGVVRPSIGICNNEVDIDRLLDAVERIARDGTRFKYEPEFIQHGRARTRLRQTGEYLPVGRSVDDLLGLGSPPQVLTSIANFDFSKDSHRME